MICGGTSPMEVERDGKKREILHDHSDMFILHLSTLVRNDFNFKMMVMK